MKSRNAKLLSTLLKSHKASTKTANLKTLSDSSSSGISSRLKSRRVPSSEISHKLRSILLTLHLGRTVRRLFIVVSDKDLESLRMYRLYNNEAGYYKDTKNYSCFALKDSKDYIERLYQRNVLKEGI